MVKRYNLKNKKKKQIKIKKTQIRSRTQHTNLDQSRASVGLRPFSQQGPCVGGRGEHGGYLDPVNVERGAGEVGATADGRVGRQVQAFLFVHFSLRLRRPYPKRV